MIACDESETVRSFDRDDVSSATDISCIDVLAQQMFYATGSNCSLLFPG